MRYEFDAKVWAASAGAGAWFFVTLPADAARGLRALCGRPTGFGSIRVQAEAGPVRWNTSVFPDSRSGSFLLPLKADVRRRAGLTAGDQARFTVEIEA